MMLNPRLDSLNDYFFRRLAALIAPVAPNPAHELIDLSIGQPMHPIPPLLTETLAASGHLWNRYPPVIGTPEYRDAARGWLIRRYGLPPAMIEADSHILPVVGTKEALFMVSQVVTPPTKGGGVPAALMPNPFYNVYLGGAVIAGAEPVLLPVSAATRHLPDLDALGTDLLERTVAFFLCSPANPQGAAADLAYWQRALELARRHDFLLIADECYSEIYTETAPTGALEAAAALGGSLDHLLVCHSLSKRSTAAGLRAGFVAGDPAILKLFTRLRSYAAAVQPLPIMAAAAALWRDESHVEANRDLYRAKFALADRLLDGHFDYRRPDGGFFLWLDVGDSEAATRRLWTEAALKVLPGAYLGREDKDGWNPGAHAIRLAMVPDQAVVEEALTRLLGTLG
jgi:aspartate/methionine/tyrosine aminotransferase